MHGCGNCNNSAYGFCWAKIAWYSNTLGNVYSLGAVRPCRLGYGGNFASGGRPLQLVRCNCSVTNTLSVTMATPGSCLITGILRAFACKVPPHCGVFLLVLAPS